MQYFVTRELTEEERSRELEEMMRRGNHKSAEDNPDLEIQILALPRVVNLTRREADMVIAVSPPSAGRLTVQKVCDYRLHLAASETYLRRTSLPQTLEDLKEHRMIGYIQDMIFDKEGYLWGATYRNGIFFLYDGGQLLLRRICSNIVLPPCPFISSAPLGQRPTILVVAQGTKHVSHHASAVP